MKCFKKIAAITAITASALLMTTGMTVMASEFTTSDQVLTIKTPDKDWKQINDSNTWVTLADGNDTITLMHYSNGESLPAMTVANDTYARVYQTVLSTKNEVFIVTGSATDKKDFKAIKKAVNSVVINKFDSKTKETQNTPEYTVEDTEATVYVVSSGLNVREDYTANASIIGGLSYGDAVTVTGIVKENGSDAGWYRISYNGETGYVSSAFTSPDQPVKTDSVTLTDTEMMLTSIDGNSRVYIYEGSDGNWYDGNFLQYTAEGAGQWSCEDGTTWTDMEVDSDSSDSSDISLQDDYGNTVYIHENTDGSFTDNQGVYYEADGAGQWSDENGNHYTSME